MRQSYRLIFCSLLALLLGPWAVLRLAGECAPPVSITGAFCGRALLTNGHFADATMSLVDASGTVVGKARTDAKGWFALPSVPAAVYAVSAKDAAGHDLHLNATVDMRDANARMCIAPVTMHVGSRECDGTCAHSAHRPCGVVCKRSGPRVYLSPAFPSASGSV